MHAIKRINFAREHPDWRFQHYETLAPAEAHNLGDRLAAALGLARPADAVQFAHALDAPSLPMLSETPIFPEFSVRG